MAPSNPRFSCGSSSHVSQSQETIGLKSKSKSKCLKIKFILKPRTDILDDAMKKATPRGQRYYSSTCSCSLCGRDFSSSKALFGHMRSHPHRRIKLKPPEEDDDSEEIVAAAEALLALARGRRTTGIKKKVRSQVVVQRRRRWGWGSSTSSSITIAAIFAALPVPLTPTPGGFKLPPHMHDAKFWRLTCGSFVFLIQIYYEHHQDANFWRMTCGAFVFVIQIYYQHHQDANFWRMTCGSLVYLKQIHYQHHQDYTLDQWDLDDI